MTRPCPSDEPLLRPPATPWLWSSIDNVASCRPATSAASRPRFSGRDLINDECMTRDTRLRQRRTDCRDRLLVRSSDRITTSASYSKSGGPPASDMARRHFRFRVDAASTGWSAGRVRVPAVFELICNRSHRIAQYALYLASTGTTLRARMTASSRSDQLSMYSTSHSMRRSNLTSVGLAAPAADLGEAGQSRPHPMARGVVRRHHLEWFAAGVSARACGRGPISDMSRAKH